MSPGSSWIVLLIAKIVVSAGFVLGVTAAVERLGPRLGALIAATPQLSVVALIFFTLEQGPAFAAESAFWTIPGMCATIPVFLGYLVAVWLVPPHAAVTVTFPTRAHCVVRFAPVPAAGVPFGAVHCTPATPLPVAVNACG